METKKKRFDFIEHTADVGLIAYGKDLPEAFSNAAYGLFSIIADLDTVSEKFSHQVTVTSEDIYGLLFEWLNELIYLFDARGYLFKRFDIPKFGDQRLNAVCYGEKYQPGRHNLKLGVKAATYHMLQVDREKNQVQVIFDV